MSYIATNLQHKAFYNYTILLVDSSCSCSIVSSYTWTDLIQGEYHFSVVAFTNKGPGEAASLMLSTIPNDGRLISYLSGICYAQYHICRKKINDFCSVV